MDDRRVTLPDIGSVDAATIAGYSLDPDGCTVRLWIDAYADSIGPVRVFTSETEDEVSVLVVPTPPKYWHGYTGLWTDEDIEADVADVIAKLDAPLGTRPIVNAADRVAVAPLAPWILERKAKQPAPQLRPVGPLPQNDPLTFRGEL